MSKIIITSTQQEPQFETQLETQLETKLGITREEESARFGQNKSGKLLLDII